MLTVPLELEQVGDVTVVRITDKRLLAEAQVEAVSRHLQRLAGDPGRGRMILDFTAVEALTSAVLGVLLSLRKRLQDRGGRLAVCSLRPDLREVFAIAGLERVLNVYPSEHQALQSFEVA